MSFFGPFGFRSGRDCDKFAKLSYKERISSSGKALLHPAFAWELHRVLAAPSFGPLQLRFNPAGLTGRGGNYKQIHQGGQTWLALQEFYP